MNNGKHQGIKMNEDGPSPLARTRPSLRLSVWRFAATGAAPLGLRPSASSARGFQPPAVSPPI
ncbi:hypothetical protein KFK09_026620 [Dendrobium nobile]|uniref:Uncharacterized protein n=1 Tax=Dendrobium nobile TaxID=94219 RepID=A0A8T3A8C4_DENNO|nr:hypothetical protein KFK09_026620 [Dendrobium nobile]